MKSLLLVLTVIISNTASAQEHSYGFKAGLSVLKTERPNYDYYNDARGLVVDGFYQFNKGPLVARTSLGYQQKGFSQELIYVDSNNVILGEGAIEKIKHSYFGLSQVVGVEFGKKLYGFATIGTRLSYYFTTSASSDEFKLNDGTTMAAYNWNLDYVEPIDVTGVIEVGAGYRMESGSRMFLIASYDHGLKKIRHANEFTPDPWKHNNYNFQIGFSQLIEYVVRKKEPKTDI